MNHFLNLFKTSFAILLSSISLYSLRSHATEVVAVDMLSELKPTTAQKDMLFIYRQSVKGLPNNYNESQLPFNGCLMNYTNTAAAVPLIYPQTAAGDSQSDLLKRYNAYGKWSVATWENEYQFCNLAKSTLTDQSSVVNFVSHNTDPSLVGNAITFYQNKVRLTLNSANHFKSLYNNNGDYRDGSKKDWAHILLSKKISQKAIPLATAKNVKVNLQSALVYYNENKAKFSGSPAQYSQTSYDTNKHAMQYRLTFTLQWLDKTICPDGKSTTGTYASFCSTYWAKYLIYIFMMDDTRMGFMSQKTQFDKGTGMYMYTGDTKALLNSNFSGMSSNPYKVVNNVVNFNYDFKSEFKKAILYGVNNGLGLPPRLNGENDDQYLAHYFVSAFSLGQELTGFGQYNVDVYQFKMSYDQ